MWNTLTVDEAMEHVGEFVEQFERVMEHVLLDSIISPTCFITRQHVRLKIEKLKNIFAFFRLVFLEENESKECESYF